MPGFKSAIFDLDGTLIDSFRDIADSWNAALLENGMPGLPLGDYRQLLPLGKMKLAQTIARSKDRERVESVLRSYLRIYRTQWHRATVAFPGVVDALIDLKQKGIAISVLSNKSHEMTCLACARFFPKDTFDVVCGMMNGLPTKPEPDQAIRIAQLIGIRPDLTALVGDTLIDVLTARRAGMTPVLACWGSPEHASWTHSQQLISVLNPNDLRLLF